MGSLPLLALVAQGCHIGLDLMAPTAVEAGLSGDDTASPALDDDTGTLSEAEDDEGVPFDTDGDDGPEAPEGDTLVVNALTPAFGPRGGGSEIAISGGDFDATSRVWFDGVEATVLSWSTTELLVETPSVAAVGFVDVDVETATAAGLLPNGFETLDFDDATGLTGALGSVEVYEVLGDYWAAGMEDFAYAWWWLLDEPGVIHQWQLFAGTTMGQCSRNAFDPSDWPELDVEIQSMLTVGGSSFAMQDALSGSGFEREFASTDYVTNGTWDLSVTSTELPDFSVPGFAITPSDFALTAPVLTGSVAPTLGSQDLDFRWTGADGDLVLIYVKRYGQDGSFVDAVGCAADAASGSFSIPASEFSGWSAGQTLYIYVGNVLEGDAVLPINNATSGVAGISWKLGGAVTTP